MLFECLFGRSVKMFHSVFFFIFCYSSYVCVFLCLFCRPIYVQFIWNRNDYAIFWLAGSINGFDGVNITIFISFSVKKIHMESTVTVSGYKFPFVLYTIYERKNWPRQTRNHSNDQLHSLLTSNNT